MKFWLLLNVQYLLYNTSGKGGAEGTLIRRAPFNMSSRGVSPAHVAGATAIPTPSLGIFPRPRQLPPCSCGGLRNPSSDLRAIQRQDPGRKMIPKSDQQSPPG